MEIFAQSFSNEALATSMTFLMSTSSDSSLFFMPSEAYFLRAASTSLRVWLKASLLSQPKRPAASQQAMTACSNRVSSAKQITYSIATLWSHQAPSRRHTLAPYTFLLARQTCPASASSPLLRRISATSLANANCLGLLFSDASSLAYSCRASLGLANLISFFLNVSCSSTSTGGGSVKLARMNSIASSQNSLRQLPFSANASFLKTSTFMPSANNSANDLQQPYSQNSLKSYTFLNQSPSKMVWKTAASSFSKRPSFGRASISYYKLEGVTLGNWRDILAQFCTKGKYFTPFISCTIIPFTYSPTITSGFPSRNFCLAFLRLSCEKSGSIRSSLVTAASDLRAGSTTLTKYSKIFFSASAGQVCSLRWFLSSLKLAIF